MKICVTGALGHIGSYLIRKLDMVALIKVYLVDNLLTQRYVSLFDLPPGIKYCFRQVDILSPEIEEIIKDSDIVVHLAAITDAESSFRNAESINKVNKEGLKYIAETCAKYRKKIIFFSTTSVYGSQRKIVDENCSIEDLKPQSPYAESKLYGERLLLDLSREAGLKFIVLRLGTIFGYAIGMRFHTAVNKFIWQASLGQEISIWKTALRQKRPYCGLNDCVNAIKYIVNNEIFDCQIYNIVTINLTVKDIIDTIREYVPYLNTKFVDSPIMNQLSYCVSNKKSLNKGFSYIDDLKLLTQETLYKLCNVNYEVKKKIF